MAATKFGLYDLLAPQFLVGFKFPAQADQYLSILAIDELHTAYDSNAVIYTGVASFTGDGGAVPVLQHKDDSGAVFQWDDVTIGFRLLVPREGSPFIQTASQAQAAIPNNTAGVALNTLLNQLGNPQPAPSDYPGIRFRLDLLFSALTFHLHKSWQPGIVGPDFRVVPDPALAGQGVKFILPKAVFTYEQGVNLNAAPSFTMDSWGNAGFDAPSDLAEGELVRMDPPLAIYENGRIAFGVDQIILDLSPNSTPPEILKFFGTDEAWEGIYIKSARFFYGDKDKSFALNFSVNDVLISFAGEVSMEARVDILGKQVDFSASVQIYDGPKQIFFNSGVAADASKPLLLTGGAATIPGTGVIQATFNGGLPPYAVSMKFSEQNGPTTELFDNNKRQGEFNPASAQDRHGSLVVTVTDSSSPKKTFSDTIDLTVQAAQGAQPNGGPLDHPPLPGQRFEAVLLKTPPNQGLPPGFDIQFTPSAIGDQELLLVTGGNALPTVSIGGQPAQPLSATRLIPVNVPGGSDANPIPIVVNYPAGDTWPNNFHLLFDYDLPGPTADLDSYTLDSPHPDDPIFRTQNPVPNKNGVQLVGAQGLMATAAVRFWIQNCLTNAPLTLDARASYEGHPDTEAHNQSLSDRRMEVAKKVVANAPVNQGASTGETKAKADFNNGANPSALARPLDRVVIIVGTPKAAEPAHALNATISRKAGVPPPPPKKKDPPPAPQPPIPEPSPVFRRLSIRLRLERNIPVMAEVSGELDFETDLEQKLRTQPNSDPNGKLALQQRPGAQASPGPNPEDGVVDFLLNVTYDTSTHFLTETLALGAGSGDRDGLLQMTSDGTSKFKNIFGALLTFTPIINAAASSVDPNSAGDWAVLGVSLAVPVVIGGFGVFQTKKVTLYGGELKLRQSIPPGGQAQFTDSAIVFDYGVAFGIDFAALNIKTTKDLMVRYKAVGFNLHFGNPVTYQPIFDTSKGYEIDLSDPGLFNLPSPLGDILKIAAARIANFNPLTLEVDIAIKADLGVITVDKFKIKMPLHPQVGPPMILPSGVKVNIPSTVKGEGFVEILDNGFVGGLDITIIPIKVRVAAVLAVESITQGNRKATAVFASLVVEFPAPIILGATGLGIYGFAGLFAMHFRRTEDPPVPNDPVGPALHWLEKAEGQPTKFKNSQSQDLWVPEMDRWSFGIGAVLGTVDGGFLVNLRGMVIVELPGPRILITVKMTMIASLPGLGDAKLTVGMLGILDLDFNLGQLTLGVLVDLSVESIISIRIPIELFFSWKDPSNWHLYLGTTTVPVSADILGIVKAYGYFMIDGKKIDPFPPPPLANQPLPGIAVALGIKASIILGDESIGLYLKVSAGADLGVSFSPKLYVVGDVFLDGELRLFVVSIGATGVINVIAPDPTYLHCHVCGSIDLFFFSISACVDFDIGSKPVDLSAPELVLGCWLQSFSPVITGGQGSDKPIDASLGDARLLGSGSPLPKPVPIDTVPVLQLHASPDVTGLTTFTEPLKKAPGFTDPDGWVNGGAGKRVRYTLTGLSIDPPVPAANGVPPATWRKDAVASKDTVTDIDLALFSRTPVTAARAFERSTELKDQLQFAWGDLCKPVAPPVCVLFTFCKQPVGPSGTGWDIFGVPMPDPPGTVRNVPAPGLMDVDEPKPTAQTKTLDQAAAAAGMPFLLPARVVGIDSQGPTGAAGQRPCLRALQLPDLITQQRRTPVPVNATQAGAIARLDDRQWVVLRTGAAGRVRLWLAVRERLFGTRMVVVDELDAKDKVIATTPINGLNLVTINRTAGLPPEWLDPAKPWLAEVNEISVILNAPEYQQLLKVLVTVKPHNEAVSLRVRVLQGSSEQPPSVLIGAAEVCSLQEQKRYDNAVQIQQGQIQTLTGYLDPNKPVPLLEPNKHYKISAGYKADVENNGQNASETHTRTFEFDTDVNPPATLGSYVLGATPAHEEKYHFWNDPTDPTEILFNDLSIIQLFLAYGKKLRLDLRAADGLPEPKDGLDKLDKVPADIAGPFYDTIKAMVASGQLSCVGALQWNYGKKTFDAKLRPLMAYTLDVVTDPPAAVDPNKAVTPLFRVQFSTGKYASMNDLISDVVSQKVRHRALTSQVALPSGGTATDQAIEDALTAAGEQTLPAANQPGITVYWAKRQGMQTFSPHAVLIDAQEPVWRTRMEHQPVAVDASDPTFVRIENVAVPALQMIETGTANTSGMVHSPGGTRTIVFFKDTFNPPPQGGPTTLALDRPKSKYFDVTAKTQMLITLTLAPTAPWEDDHE